ncbi:GatB/YqeY domain-containing protein [Egibacter rhizosphaerae]|uniref:GatB/YqeY domain-containing protein n=1 Tax=Egibacter rhizosphaerae TaxID=1670831 RepID=A0A411YJF9_9ACTN|nr:GatB/YqeY domain-containing protein [Egibacter rhizosphaerae]QBI21347.1 GatB/YqeY domain-containing protein [Egibacter rhizosphaerae]
MATSEQIEGDLKAAMKARDTETVQTLRSVLAAIKNLRAEAGHGADVTEDEITTLVEKEAKRRQEAAEAYEQGDRPELAEKERRELAILERYLPEQLSEDELRAIVDETIAEVGASGTGDLGEVMQAVMPRVKGQADGKQVNAMVRERLET